MIDVSVVTAQLYGVVLNESARVGTRLLTGRSKKTEMRDKAYRDFISAAQLAQVRFVLVKGVAEGRKQPWGFIANVTGYRTHVELVDRLAGDLVALSNAWEEVVLVGNPDVVANGQTVLEALTASASSTDTQKRPTTALRKAPRQDVTETAFNQALQQFRVSAAEDVGRKKNRTRSGASA